jgi:hypothetical protein
MTMVGLAIAHNLGESDSRAVPLRQRVLDASHDFMDKSRQVSVGEMLLERKFHDKKKYAGKKVILLMRDPRDQLLSAWIHGSKNKRYKFLDGMSLSEFLEHPEHGIDKLALFHEIWYEQRHVPKSITPLWYEDMVEDPKIALRTVMDVCGAKYTEADLAHAVDTATLEQLQEWERTGFLTKGVPKPKRPGDLDTYYHRKGKVGDHVNHFSSEDLEYCDRVMKTMTWLNLRKQE